MSKIVVTHDRYDEEDLTSVYDGDYNLSLNPRNALIVTETVGHPVVGVDGRETPAEQKIVAIFHPGSWSYVQVTDE